MMHYLITLSFYDDVKKNRIEIYQKSIFFNTMRYYSNIVSWKFCSTILYIITHLPLHTTYAKTDHLSDHFHYFS